MRRLVAVIAVIILLVFGTGSEAKGFCSPTIEDFEYMENTVHAMGRQMMLQQFFTEERIRSEGSSGIKQTRINSGGSKNYHSGTHTDVRVAAVHDHSNNIRTVGMGEFVAVMNGIEFRTRHNDYRLYMPHKTSGDYRAVQNVPFPDVPPAVTAKSSLDEQAAEMREWFKAWRDQDHSVRDYRNYFKPVLCYMEGAWTNTGKNIDEPFHSDRHFIDAQSWFELQDKIRVTSYMGSKDRLENLAFLPTKMMGFINGSLPVFAQWNYRILCHPLSRDLPTNRLRVVEDLSSRMTTKKTTYQHVLSRAARFQLNPADSDHWQTGRTTHTLLDQLMEEIPGLNNYGGKLYDTGLDGEDFYDMDGLTKKDVSKYHRWFKTKSRDAMGETLVHRGYSDDFLFAAKTTQEKVAGFERLYKCRGSGSSRTCQKTEEKWSYAIPLEIIYLTPLLTWNPFNLQYKGDASTDEGKTVSPRGRYGSCYGSEANVKRKAYNGTNSRLFFMTPSSFFTGTQESEDSADTTRGQVCVLDKDGEVRKCQASGTRIFLPKIDDVGILRTRYPIMPVHGEGSQVWKELAALREYVMDPAGFATMRWSSAVHSTDTLELTVQPSDSDKVSKHFHEVSLEDFEVKQIKGGVPVTKITSERNGHMHTMLIKWDVKNGRFYYDKCDLNSSCWDGHPTVLLAPSQDDDVAAPPCKIT